MSSPVRSIAGRRAWAILLVVALGAPAALVAGAGVAAADVVPNPTFVVTTTADAVDASIDGVCAAASGECTLRAAVAEANATTGTTIVVPGGAYVLSGGSGNDTGDLDLRSTTTITGAARIPGPGATVVRSSGDRAFEVFSTVTISGVVVEGGSTSKNGTGGGIKVDASASLTIADSTVRDNTAAEGAGIHNAGTLVVDRSTVIGNTASKKGGGIYNAGTATIRNSTIDGNSATGGGGIASSSSVDVFHATITQNSSSNSNGGGIYRVGGSFMIRGSILADNNAPDARDCYGSPSFTGVNLIESDPGCNPSGGTVVLGDPQLGPVADNGGPTQTRLPADTSPAKDQVPAGTCTVNVDQRGVARPFGAGCDLGSVEIAPLSILVDLAAAPADVKVGVATVPIGSIPPAALGTVGGDPDGTGSTALARIALARIALARIDVESSALARIALARIAVDDLALARIDLADTALARILISEVSVDGGWEVLLVGSALEGVPLQTITLADVLADPVAGPQVQDLTLETLDLSSTSLGELPLVLFAFGGQPLSDIALSDSGDPIAEWCALLELTDCSVLVDQTPVSIALARIALARIDVIASALARIALARIDVETAALARIALARIDVENTALARIALARIDIEGTALARIALARIALARIGDIVACDLVDCATGTLGDAAAAGALIGDIGDLILGLQDTPEGIAELETLTIGDLLLALAGLTELDLLTLADLFPALFSDADLPWEQIDLEAFPLQNVGDPLVAPVTYTTTFVTQGGTSDVSIELDLPDGFVLVPGSAELDGAAIADPTTTDPPAGAVLTSALTGVSPGAHVLTVQARAGIRLGEATATVIATATAGGDTATDSDEATVNVVESFELGGTPDDFKVLADGTLYVAHLSSAVDVDLYRFEITPAEADGGAHASISLSNLTADYDLTLYGPSRAPLRGDPIESFSPVDDLGLGIDPSAAFLPPDVLDDIPIDPALGSVLGIAANRSTADERIDTAPLLPGVYWVQVSGYNGAFDDLPYTLRIRERTTVLPECPDRSGTLTFPPVLGTPPAPGDFPADLDTLFLVPLARLYETYGAERGDAVIDGLAQFATDEPGGVVSGVLPVDWHADVRSAYGAWDDDRCSPDAANDVVREIGDVLDAVIAENPGVRHLVLVGDDGLIPFNRVPDATTLSNERTYAQAFDGNNELVGALGRGYLLSDDAYGASRGIQVSGRELFVPELATGRLVETPEDVVAALERFTTFDGTLDPSTASSSLSDLAALVTGYDFLSDGGRAIADALVANGLDPVDDTLINETWTADDLSAALLGATAPNVASVNAHFDHNRALPADQNAAGTEDDLFTVADVAGTGALLRTLLFSMGCHSGLSVSDVAVGGSAADTADWAQTLAGEGALLVGNTGYGYGDTELVAYSERLMALFAEGLDGSLTTGEALAIAKQRYLSSSLVLGPYDEKILQEAVHYGLPMYSLGDPVDAASAASFALTSSGGALTGVDPITGVPIQAIDLSLPIGAASGPDVLHLVETDNGDYYEVDGQVIAVQHRPVQPLWRGDASVDGSVAHGALITDLTSQDVTGFEPLFVEPIVDLSENEGLGEPIGDAVFPASLARVARAADTDELLFAAGQFRPAGVGVGTQRLFTGATFLVQYADESVTDFDAPTILQSLGTIVPVLGVGEEIVGQTVGFTTDTDATAARVYVLFKPATGSGDWRGVDLVRTPGTDHWTGGSVVPTDVDELEFLVQACDENGNCSMSDNKASNFLATRLDASGDLAVVVSGAPQSAGWFAGAVLAEIIGPAGASIQYSLDGGPYTDYTGPVPVSGEGIHLLSARDDLGNSTTVAIPIDTAGPVVSAQVVPLPNGAGWNDGAVQLTLTAIDPGGSGVASLTYEASGADAVPGTTVDGETAEIVVDAEGTTTFTFHATDAAGNDGASGTATIHVDTTAPTVAAVVTPAPNVDGWSTGGVTVAISAADGGSGVREVRYSATGAQPVGETVVPGASASIAVSSEGTTTFSYVAVDEAGNTSATGTTTVRVDATAPTIAASVAPDPVAGSGGWHAGSVNLGLLAADSGGSGIASIRYSATGAQATAETTVAGSSTTIAVTTEGVTIYSYVAVDVAGNVSSAGSTTIRIDATAPLAGCGTADGAWHASNVSIACTAGDGGSGLASAADASFSLSTTVAAGVEDPNASTGTRQVCDKVGNCATAGPIGGNMIDRLGPSIAILSPADGAVFDLGQSVTPAFSCSDAGSGVATCTSNTISTSTVGSRTFTVAATDAVGNTSTMSVAYSVAYRICLQYDPSKESPVGGTTPIKLQLCNAAGTNLSSNSIKLRAITVDHTYDPPPNPGSSQPDEFFRFDGRTKTYQYNLDTAALPIGAGFHTLEFTVDGVSSPSYSAGFTLK